MQHKKYLCIYGFTVPHSCKVVHGQDYPEKTQLADVEWNQVAQNIQCYKHDNVPSGFTTNASDILTNRRSINTVFCPMLS